MAAQKGPRRGPGRPTGPFPNFRGGPRDPKVARSLSKRGLGGALRAPWVVKNRNGDQKCVFEIVKKTFVFIANLDMPLRQSVRNATEVVKNRRSVKRSESLGSFRRAVGDPESSWRASWGRMGAPRRPLGPPRRPQGLQRREAFRPVSGRGNLEVPYLVDKRY